MSYTAKRKNLRVCQVCYDSHYYDVIVGVNNLDELDDILTDWAKQEFGVMTGSMTDPILPVPLDLPASLVYCKNISEVITTLDIDNYGYVTGT